MVKEAQQIEHSTLTDKSSITWETISTPSFQFRMAFRQVEVPTVQDRGATVEVYGRKDDEWREILKFDCFEKGPHWHRCYPDKPDLVTQLEPKGFDAGIDFGMTQLRDNIVPLVSGQGYEELVSDDRLAELPAALPLVEKRMREMARDEGPVQVLRRTMA